MKYNEVIPLRHAMKAAGVKHLFSGLTRFDVRYGTHYIRLTAAGDGVLLSPARLVKWVAFTLGEVMYLRVWLARRCAPVLDEGPQEGLEHCIELTFLVEAERPWDGEVEQ